MDGNRTRRTGIARPTRFEGGGAHQALRHLREAAYRSLRPCLAVAQIMPAAVTRATTTLRAVKNLKRLIILGALVAVIVVLARKIRET